MTSWRPSAKWHHDVIIVYLLLILLILVNFNKSLLQPQFLTSFHKQGCILKLRISSFSPCIICEDAWWFTYELQKNNDQICNSGLFFLQNALVEYIGVYSDTNNLKTVEVFLNELCHAGTVAQAHIHTVNLDCGCVDDA